jgi:hypothetical protein
MEPTTTKSTGVTPSIRDALRRAYAMMAKEDRPGSPEQQERLAIQALHDLDPHDHLDLARPAKADQLKLVVQKIINPRARWE